jgi:hypothetical protein
MNRVECPEHGDVLPAFVCAHLVSGSRLGFIQAEGPNDHPDFGDSPSAWCAACEKVRARAGGWNDESESVARVTMICVECFERARQRNSI